MTEECWLCLRTTPQRILEGCHKLFRDKDVAHKIGIKAAELLKDAYLKNPTKVSGRKTNGLMGAAVYIVSILENVPVTQYQIAAVYNVTGVTLRNIYRPLMDVLGISREKFNKKRRGFFSLTCPDTLTCNKKFRTLQRWKEHVRNEHNIEGTSRIRRSDFDERGTLKRFFEHLRPLGYLVESGEFALAINALHPLVAVIGSLEDYYKTKKFQDKGLSLLIGASPIARQGNVNRQKTRIWPTHEIVKALDYPIFRTRPLTADEQKLLPFLERKEKLPPTISRERSLG